jgi:hypothetical protein
MDANRFPFSPIPLPLALIFDSPSPRPLLCPDLPFPLRTPPSGNPLSLQHQQPGTSLTSPQPTHTLSSKCILLPLIPRNSINLVRPSISPSPVCRRSRTGTKAPTVTLARRTRAQEEALKEGGLTREEMEECQALLKAQSGGRTSLSSSLFNSLLFRESHQSG